MKSVSRRGLLISIILHTIVFLLICFSFLLSTCSRPKIVKHVFQLQCVPQENVTSLLRETPQLVAKVESEIEHKPKVERKIVAKPKEKVVAKNTISYEDFVKKQGVGKKTKVKEAKIASKIVDIPKIEMKEIRDHLEKKLSLSGTISANELMDYESYLYGLIDAAWEYPESFEGYKNGALFVFDVDGAGQLLRVRIGKTSGSRLFDESVSQAFGKIGRVKPNPHGKTLTFQLTFSKK